MADEVVVMAGGQEPVQYRDVPGFPGYRVGSDGSVWSCRHGGPHDTHLTEEWHQLRPRVNKARRPCRRGAYLKVLLHPGAGKGRNRMIHHLVLEAFVGPRPAGMVACHNDGNPQNNALSNLRWDTWISNLADMERHGTRLRGRDHANAKLTEADVIAIRRLRERGLLIWQIASLFPVSENTISHICRGEDWSHVVSPE